MFRDAARRIEASPFIIPITAVFAVMFIVAFGIAIEDYSTTLEGYRLIPTAKVNDWILPLVALLPQVGQIGFAYLFATDTNKRWAAMIAFLLHIVDVYTDVRFKAAGQGLDVWAIALVESEVVYTLGSELMLTASFGMLLRILPSAIVQIGQALRRAWEALVPGDLQE
jgi:hypothetical protein